VVAALAAILGAAVGGYVTYEGDRALQKERSLTAARGAARVLQSEFLSAEVRFQVELAQKRLLAPDRLTSISVSSEDQQLIATNVSGNAWAEVAAAKGVMQQEQEAGADTRDESMLRARAGLVVPLAGPHLEIEQSTLRALEQGAMALDPLTR
jgi:hypothetical protein